MKCTIERILHRDYLVIEDYQRALSKWKGIMHQTEIQSLDALATLMAENQIWFENNCGGHHAGQEIMVVSGIAQHYPTKEGFGGNLDKALLVYNAIIKSQCCAEIKGHAGDVARLFKLLDEK